ncbi:hypothetical protein [Sphingosinicella ginsenosidimutans]|uniref:Uncharacterized protein n=1 Tax=Allosphingosinicella ginsenosidimutans TaxID=1176539 RepID=A0A5C6TUZ9_9SPHN|nr:hypothetical protein [Sphingosinicella ginsenosidimutans]TXC64222.1 hypothetical protein FRZ32_11490 [Sphingosinicella ginsenosidimutans]
MTNNVTSIGVFERDLQYVNFAFGTAFGGYIGVILAIRELSDSKVILMMLLAAAVSSWLIYFHRVAIDVLRDGYKSHAWSVTLFLIITAGLQLMSAEIQESYLVAFRIFQAWSYVLLFCLGTNLLFMRRLNG